MAIIPLRAYNREIEGLIENGQLDEAVAHCRHILATFPKYIASYRLLGKAHLEQQRISDATDIFQRVLSSVPDDFIANVGMSIIREDENNLDAAIWHMELAYEAQPANIAIQDELRRLYGRRDGMQPPKVRLTRGALARMYAKGGLFDQAIAELRAAISEDPNRPDLQLLLAQMFYQTSQRVEAVDTCVNIIKKIPYCLEANQILAVSLPAAEGSDAIKNFRQIVISMDPYFAFVAPDAISSDQVPESAVNIERLEWKSGIQVGETPPQPNWATSLGISMEKPADENLPDWLKSSEAPAPAPSDENVPPSVSPFIWDTQEVEKIITDTSKPEEEIPDWMKDAGWRPASGEAAEIPPEEKPEEPVTELPVNEELEKADIPEWLSGIAPESAPGEESQAVQPREGDLSTPWLEQHQPGPTDSIIQWLDEKKPETPITPPVQEENLVAAPEEEMPDWLKDLDVPQPSSTPAEILAESTPATTLEPSAFLEEPAIPESPELKVTPFEEPVEQPIGIQPAQEETLPPLDVPESEKTAAGLIDEIPDWLKDIAGEQPAAESFVPAGEEVSIEPPQIILPEPPAEQPVIAEEIPEIALELTKAEMPEFTEAIPTAEVPSISEEAPTTEPPMPAKGLIVAEMPEFTEARPTAEVPSISEEVPTTELPLPAEEPTKAELPTIAEELPVTESPLFSQEAPVTELPVPAEVLPPAEVPAISEEVPTTELSVPFVEIPAAELPSISEEQPKIEQPLQVEGEVEPAISVPVTESDAFAWLEGLAAQQGAKEEELTTPPEEREIQPPEWVNLEAEPSKAESIEQEPQVGETPAAPAEEVPEWIKGLGEAPEIEPISEEPVSAIAPEIQLPQAEEIPAWLLEQEQPEPEKEEPAPTEEALEWKSDELPAWLKEIAETAPAEQTPAENPPAAMEPPVAEEVPTILTEPTAQTTEEIFPPAEVSEEAPEEPQPEIASWVPEAELPVQPAPAIPVEAEVAPTPVVEEIVTKTVEIPPVPPEAPVEAIELVPEENQLILTNARNAINQGLPTQATEFYTGLVKQNYQLNEIIKDLNDALYRFPVDVDMWVTLGDAYFRSNELQEALNAYTKAEELVR